MPYRFVASASAVGVSVSLFYHAYAAGCEPDEQLHLELVHELFSVFDGRFCPVLLALALRELNPPVLLLAVDEPNGTVRRDWPWLADEHLDALEYRCQQYLGTAPAAHRQELNNLLAGLAPVATLLPVYYA